MATHFDTENTNGFTSAQLVRANAIVDNSGLDPREQSDEYKAACDNALTWVEYVPDATLLPEREPLAAIADLRTELGASKRECVQLERDNSRLLGEFDDMKRQIDDHAAVRAELASIRELIDGLLRDR